MTNEEKDPKKEEENQQYIRRLLDSEAETRAEPAIEPKPEEPASQEGTTRASPPRRTPTPPPIALDKDNMPLPRRVDEVDMDGTRVTTVAYGTPSRPRGNTQTRRAVTASEPPPQAILTGWKDYGGCLVRLPCCYLFLL